MYYFTVAEQFIAAGQFTVAEQFIAAGQFTVAEQFIAAGQFTVAERFIAAGQFTAADCCESHCKGYSAWKKTAIIRSMLSVGSCPRNLPQVQGILLTFLKVRESLVPLGCTMGDRSLDESIWVPCWYGYPGI